MQTLTSDERVVNEAARHAYAMRTNSAPWHGLAAGTRNVQKGLARDVLSYLELWQTGLPPDDLPEGRMILVKDGRGKIVLAIRGIVYENGELGWADGAGMTLDISADMQWRYV